MNSNIGAGKLLNEFLQKQKLKNVQDE